MIRSRPPGPMAPKLLAGLAAAAMPLVAAGGLSAQEVVQALPGQGSAQANADLSDALRRLQRSPNSVPALVDAGRASLILDDVPGALGYFNRAQAIDPNDGRMLLGLALVAVRRGEAATAIQLFDNAAAAGEDVAAFSSDRGLAYDMVGQSARAQRLYRQALSRQEDNETLRRLALSYAIGGDAAASETTLLPLLQRQDRAAFRARAFALAILGRQDEAVTIAETMLPGPIAGRLAPYLRYMPQLTAAQQAAAANLGRFPSLAQIGQDTPQVAALANAPDAGDDARPALAASSNDRLTPAGAPLGRAQPVVQPLPPPSPPPSPPSPPPPPPPPAPVPPAPVEVTRSGELPAIGVTEVPVTVASAQPAAQPVPQPQPQPEPARTPPVTITRIDPTPAPAPPPAPAVEARPSFSISVPEPAAQDAEQIGLSEAFADFVLPAGPAPVTVREGAVDITTIEPARAAPPPPPPPPRPAPPPPPPPPAHPSRIWVQVATGQDTAAFRFDWRRMVRSADGALEGRRAYTARWGQTNRLLTGPFDSVRAATEFVSRLGEAGIDAFRFTSTAGEEVRALD